MTSFLSQSVFGRKSQFSFLSRRVNQLALSIVFLLILSSFRANAQNNFDACGDQSGVWSYDTVFVVCDVLIPDGEVLAIASGTVVLFQDHYKIVVEGALQAMGESMAPIHFSVSDTSGFANIHSTQGGWGGIRLEQIDAANDSSFFAHCIFNYGKAVIDSVYRYGGAICVRSVDKVRISDCVFDNNYAFYRGGAVYAEKSDMSITRSHFEGNFAGNDSLIYGYGGAVKFVHGQPDIRFCNFYNNASTGIGGAISFEFSNPKMTNCIFQYNSSGLGGAIGYLRASPTQINANLLVIDNYAAFFGGGIANVAASPMFTNTIISGNYAAMGGGLYCNEASNAKLLNSILWANTSAEGEPFGSQVWLWDTDSEPGFYNCSVQFGIEAFGGSGLMFEGPYVDCMEEDPLFAGPLEADFSLLEQSPCINTGMADTAGLALPWHDLAMNARVSGNRLDMGAYEFQEAVAVNNLQLKTSGLMVLPNPINNDSKLAFSLEQASQVGICLYNLQGKHLYERQLGTFTAGAQQLLLSDLFSPEALAPGLYLIGLKTDYQQFWLKVVW
jgi:predicted outer membrane repeat protein